MKRLIPLFLTIFPFVILNAQSYDELKRTVSDKREYFKQALHETNNPDSIYEEAQKYLLAITEDFFNAWYNTEWSFNGHTETPGKGTIACGYFVTTILRDMGFNIPRAKWAQELSEHMIQMLSNNIKRFYRKIMVEIIVYIEEAGEGLYIVGLDNHSGYIYYRNGKMSFVHSNYYGSFTGVVSEPLIGHNPLNNSKYRIVGKIFDKIMVRNWIMNIEYNE